MPTAETFRGSDRGEHERATGARAAGRVREYVRGRLWPVLVACVGLAALSLFFPSTPTYDPWAWIIWGREITELDLSTTYGPSWKPLPVVFTTIFAPLGGAAPALWLVVARAGALVALVMAFRLASRLAGGGVAGAVAGSIAGSGLLLTVDWVRHAGGGNSEALLVALVLWAVERHLDGARRQAFALGFAAALLRPEVWPFLAVYTGYVWFSEPRSRRVVAVLLLVVPIVWFVPELVGSGDPFRASERAQQDIAPGRPGVADRPALEVARSAYRLLPDPLRVAAALGFAYAALAFAFRRRERTLLALSVGALAWVALVAVMAEAGYSGNPRYIIAAVALACVVAGAGVGRLGARAVAFARTSPHPRMALAALVVAAAGALAAAAASAVPAVRSLEAQLDVLRSEAELHHDLDDAIRIAGGRDRVVACGRVYTGPYQVPVVAWHLHVHFSGVSNLAAAEPTPPATVFRARSGRSPYAERRVERAGVTAEWEVLAACEAGAAAG